MRRLRVAFVLPSLQGGGSERTAVTLLTGLADRGYELSLFLFVREGVYFDRLPANVRVKIGKAGRFARFWALRRWLREEPQDVVVSFLSHFTVYAAVRAAGTGAKYIINQGTPLSAFLRDPDFAWRRPVRRRLFATLARRVYSRADAVEATSQGIAEDLVHNYDVPRHRISILHNPVDVDEIARAGRQPLDGALLEARLPTVISAGRLAHAKNLPLLVDALHVLARRLPYRAWILGQGELEGELRDRLTTAGLKDRVSLLGFQGNPWKFMARADVFLLTSRYEGFGNVVIEAMASGLPVVATASDGTREIVQHEHNGLLVEEHTADAVASAIERVLAEPGLHARLAAAARLRAAEFTVASVVDRLDASLRALVAV